MLIGDEFTAFYAAKPGCLPPAQCWEGAQREAYAWGALTSSARGRLGWLKRAGWLTLLPFALTNLAMWARPGLATMSWRRLVAALLVRIASLLMTALLVATMCGVGIDLVAWQCFR